MPAELLPHALELMKRLDSLSQKTCQPFLSRAEELARSTDFRTQREKVLGADSSVEISKPGILPQGNIDCCQTFVSSGQTFQS